MLDKEELGRRLRAARFDRNMTLKEVAAGAGMSATHISEVERGKTSPTIGALERIARSLERKPSFFLEERELPSVHLTPAHEACTFFITDLRESSVEFDVVGPGVPGGLLKMIRRTFRPGELVQLPAMIGELVVICLEGMARYTAQGESIVLREGDALQLSLADGMQVENIGDEEYRDLSAVATPIAIPS